MRLSVSSWPNEFSRSGKYDSLPRPHPGKTTTMPTLLRSRSIICALATMLAATLGAADDAALPSGVVAVWDAAKAVHEATPTRERVCLNGLWRWQPAEPTATAVPEGGWGYFKVPGWWPGR
jgi:hypothetical protein